MTYDNLGAEDGAIDNADLDLQTNTKTITDQSGNAIGDFAGSNLSVSSGSLNAASPSSDDIVARSDADGFLFINSSGDYEARHPETSTAETHSTDASVPLQELVLTMAENPAAGSSTGERIGLIAVGSGTYTFESAVELGTDNFRGGTQLDARGLTIWGRSSFKQSNQWSATVFEAGAGMTAGRGILEFGGPNRAGLAAGCHVKGIFFDCNDQNNSAIYNWGNDRVRLTDVKQEHSGSDVHGIFYVDSYNSTWKSVYAHGAAHITDTGTAGPDKGTNSFRMLDCTFNTEHDTLPTFTAYGDGWKVSNSIFNTKDVIDGHSDDTPVVSGRSGDIVQATSDTRISGTDHSLEGKFGQIDFLNTNFPGGATQTYVFRGGQELNFVNCGTSNADVVFQTLNDTQIIGFTAHAGGTGLGTVFDWRDSGVTMDRVSVIGSTFKEYGGRTLPFTPSGSEVAAVHTGNRNYSEVIFSGNTFISGNANYDFNLDYKSNGVAAVGNVIGNGVLNDGSERAFDARAFVNNPGYNPVGFDQSGERDAPAVPAADTEWINENRQPATILLDGNESGITLYDTTGASQNAKTDSGTNSYVDTAILGNQSALHLGVQEGVSFTTPPTDWAVYWH